MNYSTVAAPLTDLLKKDRSFSWTQICQESFDHLKRLLMNSPVLTAPDFNRPFMLAVDACDRGIGAVLLQGTNQSDSMPVAYYSKKLNRHQQNYSTIEKEALALVLAVQHFELYITNGQGEVIVYTDHNPLAFLDRMKTRNQRLYRWGLLLQSYPIRIEHVAGKDNVIADALSRT